MLPAASLPKCSMQCPGTLFQQSCGAAQCGVAQCGVDADSIPLPSAPLSKWLGVVWQQMSSRALWGAEAGTWCCSAKGRQSRSHATAWDVVAPWRAPAPDLQKCLICASLLHGAVPELRISIISSRCAQSWQTICVPTSLYSPRASLPAHRPRPQLCWLSSFSFDKVDSVLECRMAAGLPPA